MWPVLMAIPEAPPDFRIAKYYLKPIDLGADDVFARISDPCLCFLEGWPNE
jgi:hypothetical protein